MLSAHLERIPADTAAGANLKQHEIDRITNQLRNQISLSAPNAQKIENTLLSQFGIPPDRIEVPGIAHFTARSKQSARGGAGSGNPLPFSGTWQELATHLNTIQYFRNATVHADTRKLETIPGNVSQLSEQSKASLWATTVTDDWSIQMPHAVTALRTVVAVFNTVVYSLDERAKSLALASTTNPVVKEGISQTNVGPNLRLPDQVVPFRE